MSQQKNILVFRFSALGDVALTIPVFIQLGKVYPEITFHLVTQKRLAPLFETLQNVQIIGVDFKGEHNGVIALQKLANQFNKQKFDAVVDLHDVLRSKYILANLSVRGNSTYTFTKGRKAKQQQLNVVNPKQLKHTCQRYLEAFSFLGKPLELDLDFDYKSSAPIDEISYLIKPYQKAVGIAPFSQHESKEWLIGNWRALIEKLHAQNIATYVFAFGERENSIATTWTAAFPTCNIINEAIPLQHQLTLIQHLSAMVSVDSGNMHLASLLGIPTISLWFATHPNIGFAPLNNEDGIILPNSNKFEASSIYGKISKDETPKVNSYKNLIEVEIVYNKILEQMN